MRYYLPEYERKPSVPTSWAFPRLFGAVAKSPAMLHLPGQRADGGRQRHGRRWPVAKWPTAYPRGATGDRPQQPPRCQSDARGHSDVRPAMARRPRGLNENYARELLELHTLGVDGGYVQQDVIEVARALTGWTVRPARLRGDGGFWFNPAAHDADEKVVLGHPMGSKRGIDDGEQVLDIVARHPSTATVHRPQAGRAFRRGFPAPGADRPRRGRCFATPTATCAPWCARS